MDEVFEQARSLGRSIGESSINADYNEALEKIMANPRLADKIREFKRIQSDNAENSEKHLSKLYFDLCLNEDAKRFFECERRLLALMLGVHENLWSGCNTALKLPL